MWEAGADARATPALAVVVAEEQRAVQCQSAVTRECNWVRGRGRCAHT